MKACVLFYNDKINEVSMYSNIEYSNSNLRLYRCSPADTVGIQYTVHVFKHTGTCIIYIIFIFYIIYWYLYRYCIVFQYSCIQEQCSKLNTVYDDGSYHLTTLHLRLPCRYWYNSDTTTGVYVSSDSDLY